MDPRRHAADVKQLNPRHLAMAVLVSQGFSSAAIARKIGMSETRVSQVRASPLFKLQVERLQTEASAEAEATAKEILERGTRKAFKMYEDFLDWPSFDEVPASSRIAAGKEFTDRTHPKPSLGGGALGEGAALIFDEPTLRRVVSVMVENDMADVIPTSCEVVSADDSRPVVHSERKHKTKLNHSGERRERLSAVPMLPDEDLDADFERHMEF